MRCRSGWRCDYVTLCTLDYGDDFVLLLLRHVEAVHAVPKDRYQFLPLSLANPEMLMSFSNLRVPSSLSFCPRAFEFLKAKARVL
jgi:hypothetical protein